MIMILGFKEQFEMPIKKGTKVHSIREDKHNRWKSGILIHFAKGVRTKNYINFMLGQCFSTQKIKIMYNNIQPCGNTLSVSIDDWELSLNEIERLAINDGFDSMDDFLNWFDKDFFGKVIHWTDLRY